MFAYDTLEHHPLSEQVVESICNRLQTQEPMFFRCMVAYFFATAASAMRTTIKTPEGNEVPVNIFSLALAPSGFGKGRVKNLMEDEVLNQFQHRFLQETFPILAEQNIHKIALNRARRKASDPDEELELATREFERQLGPYLFSFDSGSAAAVKQMRQKILMANSGCLNLQVDEIGNNLMRNRELFDVGLELYDGKVKAKLTKNSSDNIRNEELPGLSPTNMMLFGSPSRLLNGASEEEELLLMLEAGYARRCLFGYIRSSKKKEPEDPLVTLQRAQQTAANSTLETISDRFANLADMINANKRLVMPDNASLAMYQYKADCERRASQFREHEETQRIELEARFFKALKLAGVYAFVDDSPEITEQHYLSAVKVVEESGEALSLILRRDKPYVKLARYFADLGEEVTHADLVEDLPFYPKAQNQRQDMLNLAIAWGYKNNIVIKKSFQDGIEFLRGESLKETDLTKLRVAYSNDLAQDYKEDFAPFDKLHILTQAQDKHWVNHAMRGGHRAEDNAIPGFNLVVIDVDGGVSLDVAKSLLSDYKALYYTTKRHTPEHHRFRIIFPTSHELFLDAKDYKEFMAGIFEWLPFDVDKETGQRSRKWLSHNGHYEYTDGELLDVLSFIPKTSKNEERKKCLRDSQSLDNLERWVMNNTGDGNRNQMLHRYARILIDAGFDYGQIQTKVMDLNDKLMDKLDESEILSTVMTTVGKTLSKQK